MKFLVDAQLPPRLAAWLREQGHDAIHARDLVRGNSTPDSDIIALADHDRRVVVTKDSDFARAHLRYGRPELLLIVALGNATNRRVLDVFSQHLSSIVSGLSAGSYVEITPNGVFARDAGA